MKQLNIVKMPKTHRKRLYFYQYICLELVFIVLNKAARGGGLLELVFSMKTEIRMQFSTKRI